MASTELTAALARLAQVLERGNDAMKALIKAAEDAKVGSDG